MFTPIDYVYQSVPNNGLNIVTVFARYVDTGNEYSFRDVRMSTSVEDRYRLNGTAPVSSVDRGH
jgi:hypothetical protein